MRIHGRTRSRRLAVSASLAGVISTLLVAMLPPGAQAATGVPYTDPSAKGTITLCNQTGQPVLSGSIHAVPFVWTAIADSSAPAAYGTHGETATLFGYQPRQDVDPRQWSGQAVTASSRVTNPRVPVVQSTDQDSALDQLIASFPPQVDGLIQLRVYLGAPNSQSYDATYPSVDLRISGDTWSALEPGTVACAAASGKSDVTVLQGATPASSQDAAEVLANNGRKPHPLDIPPPATLASPVDVASVAPTAPAPGAAVSSAPIPGASPSTGRGTPSPGAVSSGAVAATAARSPAPSGGRHLWLIVVIGLIVIAVSVRFVLRRRS